MTQLWKIVEGLNCTVAVVVLADVGVGVDGTWHMAYGKLKFSCCLCIYCERMHFWYCVLLYDTNIVPTEESKSISLQRSDT